MTLDIKGGLKNTAISSNRYVVVEELLSNSIDSYLIRRNTEQKSPELFASLEIEFFNPTLLEGEYDIKISCRDNGAGFGYEQIKAFVTKDTSYKDYLKIQGIGRCKGAGRIQFFHYFDNLKIDSVFLDGTTHKRTTLNIASDAREITEEHFSTAEATGNDLITTVILQNIGQNIPPGYIDRKSIRHDFSSETLGSHIYTVFLQRLIILKASLENFLLKSLKNAVMILNQG